ncbi:putative quinol monooxygenase [Raineyella sp. W15-4]|uniref:putative quinol monooxygenase n=1 Tax=Raineyella sp. W15-4 TaxID=3081651 RepID=UPI0029558AA5|nr:antibiotic biosynthesis monooxygenase [Raineyella sp. W15-4]WOQ16805.1 antibiotic biosynthesis monooxygenase [Raineyella sp. W15-4]
MLRVLHEFHDLPDPGPLREETAVLRRAPGCASAELYASLDGSAFHVLTMLWETEEAYDAFWRRALAGDYPVLTDLVTGAYADTSVTTEFYRREIFALRDGVWEPERLGESHRAIRWPAAGAVRVVIQHAVQASPAMYERIGAEVAETRREEGCLVYHWCEDVDLPGHLLLVELWADQVIYDRHWALRGATAAFRGDTLRIPARPQRGPETREFYRRQRFRHLYERWLPADSYAYATTVSWPAG